MLLDARGERQYFSGSSAYCTARVVSSTPFITQPPPLSFALPSATRIFLVWRRTEVVPSYCTRALYRLSNCNVALYSSGSRENRKVLFSLSNRATIHLCSLLFIYFQLFFLKKKKKKRKEIQSTKYTIQQDEVLMMTRIKQIQN